MLAVIVHADHRAGAQLPPPCRACSSCCVPTTWPRSCASRSRPRRRAGRPRWPTAPRRSSSPPPATICASRCMPWACSPRRCASATSRGGEPRQQHQRLGGRARRPVLRAAGHHPHRRRRYRRRPQSFEVGDILRKLRLHFEPTAFEKGLALTLRGGTAWCADPLLVERILRNLVSNAIRYTNDGGVLVAARRAAARCILQVWDRAWASARKSRRVFEEFYRVPNTPAVAPTSARAWAWGWPSSSAWPT